MYPVLLRVEHLSRVYRSGFIKRTESTVFSDVTFSMKSGESLGIFGPSGSGKTTLARILAGMESHFMGKIYIHGEEISRLGRKKRREKLSKIQMLFQDPEGSFNPRKTIGRSLSEVLPLAQKEKECARALLPSLLHDVGLNPEVLTRLPRQISGGQNQRAALARILLLEPDVLVLDEPTSLLDVSVQAQILHLIRNIQKKMGLSLIFISHDKEVVRFMCSRIGTMKGGTLIFSEIT